MVLISEDGVVVEILRSRTLDTRCDGFNYRLLPQTSPRESEIELATTEAIHKISIRNARANTFGPMEITNRLVRGVPLGMHVFHEATVQFRDDFPQQLEALFVPLVLSRCQSLEEVSP